MCKSKDLIFQGSKFFWRTRNNIDVAIVSHNDLATTEVIAYDPTLNKESERIYLNSNILYSMMNQAEIEAKFSFAKQNDVPHTAKFVADVVNDAISHYLLNRLFIKAYSKEDMRFAVQLQFAGARCNDVVCAKPAELLPHTLKHHQLYTVDQIVEANLALEEARSSLVEQCMKATELQAEVGVQLCHKERWRIPLVLVKMSKHKELNDTDEKIWAAVSGNLKNQDDLDKLTNVMLHTVAPRQSSTPTHRTTRSPGSTATNGVTGNRNPSLSSPAHANSQRLFSGTASSQRRVIKSVKEEAPAALPPRKVKHANSKSGTRKSSPRKLSKRVVPLKSTFFADNGDSEDNTTSVMAQLVSGARALSAILSTKLSGKHHYAHAEGRASVGIVGTDADDPSSRLSEQCDQLNGDISDCTPCTKETSTATAGEISVPLSTQVSIFSAQQGEEAAYFQGSARVKPAKRRSYFSALLASFSAATPMYPSDAPGISTGTNASAGEQTRTTRASFSNALAAWFPWSHSSSVVPTELFVPE